ncbi:MAG TPA: hypothetical protein VKU38_22970 [Ktedonobacteraceae bacterium]|nr:hypothetical protein [Ktedonobacteraceae bacterium]
MSTYVASYVFARTDLLAHITTTLQNDERFVAAWLTGSFGRGEQDVYSDLDIRVIVADDYSEAFCAQPWPDGARTTDERLALFSLFGIPSVIYDAHGNAPEGGTFTYVLYENGLNVDWILVPQSKAQRASDTLLLFDTVGVSMEPAYTIEPEEIRAKAASEQVNFFWTMTPIAVKYMLREQPVAFHDFLELLHNVLREAERLVAGEPEHYHGGAYATLCTTLEERVNAIRQLCERMLALMPQVAHMGGYVAPSPMSIMTIWLAMADNSALQARYAANREAVLARIVETLQADERIVATWLSGSYSRHEQDRLSDLDLRIVVADEYANALCEVPWETASPTTIPERLEFIRQFGEPGIIFDTKSMWPEGGSFTLALYYETGLHLDWVLLPQANAQRPAESMVLFDMVNVPLEPAPEPESLEQRITTASDMTGFFWMIAASSLLCLYPPRYDPVQFHLLLDWLHNALHDVQHAVDGTAKPYHSGAYAQLAPTRREQIAAYRDLCNRMLALMPEVERMGGYVPLSPMQPVALRLRMLEETEM